MANHVSALKRDRQNKINRQRNRVYKSRIVTIKTKLFNALGGDESTVNKLFGEVQSAIYKGQKKGIIHKNKAARTISRLHKRIYKNSN